MLYVKEFFKVASWVFRPVLRDFISKRLKCKWKFLCFKKSTNKVRIELCWICLQNFRKIGLTLPIIHSESTQQCGFYVETIVICMVFFVFLFFFFNFQSLSCHRLFKYRAKQKLKGFAKFWKKMKAAVNKCSPSSHFLPPKHAQSTTLYNSLW